MTPDKEYILEVVARLRTDNAVLREQRNDLQDRYEALMEGMGLDPSPECYGEYPYARLRAAGYGVRMLADRLEEERNEATALCHELHALLWHYDLARQPNGVDWGQPDALRQEYITKLEALFSKVGQS